MPYKLHGSAANQQTIAYSIGAVSPDIFYYDLPSFSLSPLGNVLHDFMNRKGISVIYDWIDQNSSSLESGPHLKSLPGGDNARKILWGLGFAGHFLADAAWHPLIEEWSRSPLDYCRSETECHRLLESELEALWLARSPEPEKYDDFLNKFRKDRRQLFEIASYYRRFLEFAGLSSQAGPARTSFFSSGAVRKAGVSERRIVRCFLLQNFLLRLFANKMLGRQRDRLLAFSPFRFLGVLVTPARPILPAVFSRVLPEKRNLFSDSFAEQSVEYVRLHLCELAERLQKLSTGSTLQQ